MRGNERLGSKTAKQTLASSPLVSKVVLIQLKDQKEEDGNKNRSMVESC